MLISEINENAKCLLNALSGLLSPCYDFDIDDHGKVIRDLLDTFEGHLHECYNSRGKYSHSSLKHNATCMSESTGKLRDTLTQKAFLDLTHREHAKPIAIIIKEANGLSGEKLLTYLYENLKSVTILKEEAKIIDKKYKTTMPDATKIFSRFEEFGIKIIKRK